MFRALLHQLCLVEPSVILKVSSFLADKSETQGNFKEDWDWHVKEVKSIFTRSLIEVASMRRAMLFVDALNETGAVEANDLAEYFNDLSSKLLAKKA